MINGRGICAVQKLKLNKKKKKKGFINIDFWGRNRGENIDGEMIMEVKKMVNQKGGQDLDDIE